jgi:hypothetical protein
MKYVAMRATRTFSNTGRAAQKNLLTNLNLSPLTIFLRIALRVVDRYNEIQPALQTTSGINIVYFFFNFNFLKKKSEGGRDA